MVRSDALRWDIFCRVIDNFGDVGVCWRLSRQLAAAGDRVRLVLDDARALSWLADADSGDVEVLPWPGPAAPADVVVEAFGCDPPPAYVKAMAAMATVAARPPVWINLEYLSAEDYVERSHGLPSPQSAGLRKWFFFPGFTRRTGGLLRESGLAAQRAGFDRRQWLAQRGLAGAAHERVVSLFCYDGAPLPALLQDLAAAPTLVLLTPGPAQDLAAATALPAAVRTAALPWLTQDDFDRLLWSSDLNIVRGEDSLVRAMWAGAPFLWQAYPQHDGAHGAKIEALALRMQLPEPVRRAWRGWNGLAPWPGLPLDWAAWRAATLDWRDALLAQPELATQLRAFAVTHGAAPARAGPRC